MSNPKQQTAYCILQKLEKLYDTLTDTSSKLVQHKGRMAPCIDRLAWHDFELV